MGLSCCYKTKAPTREKIVVVVVVVKFGVRLVRSSREAACMILLAVLSQSQMMNSFWPGGQWVLAMLCDMACNMDIGSNFVSSKDQGTWTLEQM